jgi:hypothetical protein
MQIIINSSNIQRNTWTDLLRNESGEYFILSQANRLGAPKSYTKISEKLANRFIGINKRDRNRAIEAMNHYLYSEVQEKNYRRYRAFWAEVLR